MKETVEDVMPFFKGEHRIFAEGALGECFVNGRFAQSCVVKGPRKGGLEISAEGGVVEVRKLLVKTRG